MWIKTGYLCGSDIIHSMIKGLKYKGGENK